MRKDKARSVGLRFFSFLLLSACVPAACAQVSRDDVFFAAMASQTMQATYQPPGGDMKPVLSLIDQANKATADPVAAYRAWTHAMFLMAGAKWTPTDELITALDFSIQQKIIEPGEYLQSRATFLFDAPAAAEPPYRLELEIVDDAQARQAVVAPGIILGDIRGRRGGETIGLTFDPSKLVAPGLHTLHATLKDGGGAVLYQYYRTFAIIPDLASRLATLEKALELLPDQKSTAAASARRVLETVTLAHQSYLAGSMQNLAGFLYTALRGSGIGFGLKELMDFDAELERAARMASAMQAGRNPLDKVTGDVRLAYRSGFDGKLAPYRVYIPSKYEKSRKYPLIVLLHGAGLDENSFFDFYDGLWPKLAEQHGFILAAASGRSIYSRYDKQDGGEQDVLDVLDLMQKNYSIDRARVYLAGHSRGGEGTWKIGFEYRNRFSALAPIAGTRISAEIDTALASGRKIPIMIITGAKDILYPVADCRAIAEKFKALGSPVKYAEYPEGDHITVGAMSVSDTFNWFDTQRMEKR
jgi:poly(3-hydroxybutyrate) depolymerase